MGKRTTTTREYDAEGRLVRETVLEEITGAPPDVAPLVQPIVFPSLPKVEHTACTCPMAFCPMHAQQGVTVWPGRLPQAAGFQFSINVGAADNYSRSHELAGIGKQWLDNNAGVYS